MAVRKNTRRDSPSYSPERRKRACQNRQRDGTTGTSRMETQMIDYKFNGQVIRVIDGDTFDALVDLGFHVITTQRFRMLGIDAPEKGTPGANEATAYLSSQILNKNVVIQSYKGDSFGRWLATVWLKDDTNQDSSINGEMIKLGLAKVYSR